MHTPRSIAAALILVAVHARGQTSGSAPAATNAPPQSPEQSEPDRWLFSVAAYTYLLPDDDDVVQPTVTADRGWLHLEARYNYEALDTASAWVGYNFSGGPAPETTPEEEQEAAIRPSVPWVKQLAWEFTPMLGGVFGDTVGIAPGYKGSLSWWRLELYSEGEFVIDTGTSSESFFYTWSELALAPVDWFRFGLVTQRTRLYEEDVDIQRGVLAGFSYEALDLTAYVFNPDEDEPTVVVAVGLSY